jgi:plastocyanin
MNKIRLALAALCVVAGLAACGGESGTDEHEDHTATATATATTTQPAEGTGPPGSAATITMAGMSFGDPITVAPGTQITLKNDDSAEHSVTSQTAGQFDVHVDGKQQGTLTAPAQPGEYAFYCVYHPAMKGTLVVK